jgi:hypothetical protein
MLISCTLQNRVQGVCLGDFVLHYSRFRLHVFVFVRYNEFAFEWQSALRVCSPL